MNKPLARKDNIVVQKIEDETLVYDLDENKAFCLNETSALVWKLCDGQRDSADIVDALDANTPRGIRDDLVLLSLNELARANLIAESQDFVSTPATRREMIKKIGKATLISLPLVFAVTAPNAYQAQSGCPPLTTNPCNPPGSIPTGCPCSFTLCAGACAGTGCNSITQVCF